MLHKAARGQLLTSAHSIWNDKQCSAHRGGRSDGGAALWDPGLCLVLPQFKREGREKGALSVSIDALGASLPSANATRPTIEGLRSLTLTSTSLATSASAFFCCLSKCPSLRSRRFESALTRIFLVISLGREGGSDERYHGVS